MTHHLFACCNLIVNIRLLPCDPRFVNLNTPHDTSCCHCDALFNCKLFKRPYSCKLYSRLISLILLFYDLQFDLGKLQMETFRAHAVKLYVLRLVMIADKDNSLEPHPSFHVSYDFLIHVGRVIKLAVTLQYLIRKPLCNLQYGYLPVI